MGLRGPLPRWTPVSDNLFESSLMDEPDLAVRWLMVVCIKIANEPGRGGDVDMTVTALASKARMSVDDTLRALSRLTAPDANSRTPDHGGARLIPISGDRAWGWRLVNWEKYRVRAKVTRVDAATSTAKRDGVKTGTNSAKLRKRCETRLKGNERKEKEREEDTASPPARPSLSEVKILWDTESLRGSPERFFHHHEARGWAGLLEWRAEARKWAAGERTSTVTDEPIVPWGANRPPEADLEWANRDRGQSDEEAAKE